MEMVTDHETSGTKETIAEYRASERKRQEQQLQRTRRECIFLGVLVIILVSLLALQMIHKNTAGDGNMAGNGAWNESSQAKRDIFLPGKEDCQLPEEYEINKKI